MPIYPYSFQLPPLNVQDIPNDGAPGEFLGISAGGALDWLPAGGGGSGDMLAANNLSELTNFATARTNIGLGTTSTPTFANLTLTSPSLASSAPVTISQTWNAVGQTFKALVVNAAGTSDANSASGSLLADFQLGGATKAKIDKLGIITANRIILDQSGSTYQLPANTPVFWTGASFLRSPSAGLFSFENNTQANFFVLAAEAANTLALRNGALAQTFNVYGTYTSGSVYERMFMRYNGGTPLAYQIGTETIGATARPLEFLTAGVKRMALSATGSPVATLFAPSNTVSNILVLRNLSDAAKFQFYLNASGNSEFYIGASNVLLSEVGNSYFNGGNVGIGTTAPGSTLTVAGTFHFGSNNGALIGGTSYGGHLGSTQHFGLRSTSAVSTTIYLQNNSSGDKNAMVRILGSGSGADHGALDINTIESSPILFTTGLSNERMRITAAGNVGIGTTSPTSKLHVVGDFILTGYTAAGNFGTLACEHSFSPRVNNTGSGPVLSVESSSNWTAGVARFRNTKNNWSILFPSTSTATIQLGGTDLNFPALKQTGASIDVRLADDTAFTSIQDLYRRFGAGTPEGVVTAPIGAVYHNTTGGANTSFYVKESGTGNTGWVGK